MSGGRKPDFVGAHVRLDLLTPNLFDGFGGLPLPDDLLVTVRTPAQFVTVVNDLLGESTRDPSGYTR